MNANLVAIAKMVKKKVLETARQGLAVGTHPIDCTVHITGTINVGKDSEVDATSGSVDYKAAFATVCGLLAEKCRQNGSILSAEMLRNLIGMAMRQGEVAESAASVMAELIEAEERECTKVTGKKTKKGSVTTKLEYAFEEAAKSAKAA